MLNVHWSVHLAEWFKARDLSPVLRSNISLGINSRTRSNRVVHILFILLNHKEFDIDFFYFFPHFQPNKWTNKHEQWASRENKVTSPKVCANKIMRIGMLIVLTWQHDLFRVSIQTCMTSLNINIQHGAITNNCMMYPCRSSPINPPTTVQTAHTTPASPSPPSPQVFLNIPSSNRRLITWIQKLKHQTFFNSIKNCTTMK
jgi:hypothetical protein